ncbi:hypothetical protein M5K25_026007 [Dendrobium thyrsiflorum]|uniref:VQ domain-containing protein n=1 Tax=Dendrobium thyrsiflorum TaxID=117978 RepID=A0ABD0TWC7_DENTH
MKIKFIFTQFVEIDEARFKSEVQRLTGKDSIIVDCKNGKRKEPSRKRIENQLKETIVARSVDEEKVDAFVVPQHAPTMDELFELLGD